MNSTCTTVQKKTSISQVKSSMSISNSQSQNCVMRLIESILENLSEEDLPEYKVFPEISLARATNCLKDQQAVLDHEDPNLWHFRMSCSTLDILVCRYELYDYYPSFAVEFQGPNHDKDERRRADRKKVRLMQLAGIPLLHSTEKKRGIVEFRYPEEQELLCSVDVYRNRGREELKREILSILGLTEQR